MLPTQDLVRFVSLALLFFLLLMSLTLTGFYPPLFRAGATLLFQDLGSRRIARFEPVDDPQGLHDTRLSVGSDADGRKTFPSGIGINTVREGYAPLALVAALVLATPTPWRRRFKGLAAGLVLVQGFVALRLAVTVMSGFSRAQLGERHLLEVGPMGMRLLRRADQMLSGDLHLTYIVAILIWLVVTRHEGRYLSTFFPSKARRPAE